MLTGRSGGVQIANICGRYSEPGAWRAMREIAVHCESGVQGLCAVKRIQKGTRYRKVGSSCDALYSFVA
jgi:hypothetical protein